MSQSRFLRVSAIVAFALTSLATAGALAQQQPQKVPVAQVPVFERIEPTAGPVGTEVTIIGRRFHPNGQMFLGETQLQVVTHQPNRLVVRIPQGATTGRINFRIAIGSHSPRRTDGPEFRVTQPAPAPIVERFEPAAGPPGAQVTIHGRNFSPRLTENTVLLGTLPAVVRNATPFAITVTVPAAAVTAPWTVRVASAGEARSAQPFTVQTAVTITDFQPRLGPPGTRVTLTGTGFNPSVRQNRVFMNNVPVRVETATATQLVVSIPANAASGPILVDVRNSGRAQTSAPFTIQFAPTIASWNPSFAAPGRQFVIRGTNFGTDIRQVQVAINARPATIRNITATELTVEVPTGATTGKIRVTVNGLSVESPRDFVVVEPVAITDFQPRSGPPNTTVVITGRGFVVPGARNNITVNMGGARLTVLQATPTELRVRVPAGSVPSAPIRIVVENNGEATTSAPFVITAPPTIARFEPAHATVGSELIIHGTNFGANATMITVRIGDAGAAIRQVTNERVTVVIPNNARTGFITVEVRMQGSARSATQFTVDPNFRITAITPTSGLVGSQVTIRGEGFGATGTTVTFTGVTRPQPATFVSATEIRVTVPAGAQTGPLTVRIADGRTAATGAFTVTAPPAGVGVSAVEPVCTHAGCVVIVRGWGFSASVRQNRVMFNGQPVRVAAATPVQLTLNLPNVPPATAPLQISVRNVGEAATAPFTLTARPAATPATGAAPATGTTATTTTSTTATTGNTTTTTTTATTTTAR